MSFSQLPDNVQAGIVVFTPLVLVLLIMSHKKIIEWVKLKNYSIRNNYQYLPLNVNILKLVWHDILELFLYDSPILVLKYKFFYSRYLPRFYSKSELNILNKYYPEFFEPSNCFKYDFPNLKLNLSRVKTKSRSTKYYPNKILTHSLFNSEYVYVLEDNFLDYVFVNPYSIFNVLIRLHNREAKKQNKTLSKSKLNSKMEDDLDLVSKFVSKNSNVLDEKDLTF